MKLLRTTKLLVGVLLLVVGLNLQAAVATGMTLWYLTDRDIPGLLPPSFVEVMVLQGLSTVGIFGSILVIFSWRKKE